MTNEEIKKGIQNYYKLQVEKQTLFEIEKLKKEVSVIRYIELLNSIGKNPDTSILSEEQIAFEAFDELALHTSKSNKIYIYIGYPEQVTYGEPMNMRIYKDLETGYEKKVHPFDLTKFANHYRVIHPSTYDNDYQRTLEYYNNIRNNFFLQLTTVQQEEAVQKILKK